VYVVPPRWCIVSFETTYFTTPADTFAILVPVADSAAAAAGSEEHASWARGASVVVFGRSFLLCWMVDCGAAVHIPQRRCLAPRRLL